MRQVIVLSDLTAAKYASVYYAHSGWVGVTPDGNEERLGHGALEVVPLDTLLAGNASVPEPEPPATDKPKGRAKK